MKKLTKRVQAGGLWFDVPVTTQWVTVGSIGLVHAFDVHDKPIASETLQRWDSKNQAFRYENAVQMVALEGTDWRECCWYVGNQTDGEAAERREWMARGVESFVEYNQALASDYPGAMVAKALGVTEVNAECHSQRIRLGEVDCE